MQVSATIHFQVVFGYLSFYVANGGTLSSYTWTCMIINFLQQRQPPILPVLHKIDNEGKDEAYFYDDIEKLRSFGSENKESLGGLLFAFFRRFALEFDYDDQVVSVREGRYLTKAEKGWDTGRNKMSLCVEEPFNVSRNLGNSADVASVRGLRCEFQRFLELLVAGEDLKTICTPYQPLSLKSTTEIPNNSSSSSSSNNNNSNTLTLTLPQESRTSSFFLPIYPYSECSNPTAVHNYSAHPYDRRRSMVDGICSYPTPNLSDHSNTPYPTHPKSYTYRALPISKPYNTSFNTFHPRFSSPQALDTILRVRNTRHGSHPLPPVPSTLLSMLNISANHADQSVEKIFARYHRKPQPPPPPSHPKSTTETKGIKKNGNTYRRKGPIHANGKSHDNVKRIPNSSRRRSSGIDWPTIGTNSPSQTTTTEKHSISSTTSSEPQRLRRWSTTKKHAVSDEPRQKTLAEIVKIATPPIRQKSAPSSPIPSSSTSSGSKSSGRHRRQRNGNKGSNTSSNAKQKKKSSRT